MAEKRARKSTRPAAGKSAAATKRAGTSGTPRASTRKPSTGKTAASKAAPRKVKAAKSATKKTVTRKAPAKKAPARKNPAKKVAAKRKQAARGKRMLTKAQSMAQMQGLLEAKHQRDQSTPAWAAMEGDAHAGGQPFQSHTAPETITDTPPAAALHIKQPTRGQR